MLSIDIVNDGDLQEAVNPFISSLLPHENYNVDYFSRNLEIVFHYIQLNEFKLEYRLIFSALEKLNRLKTSISTFRPKLSRESFLSLLSNSIYDVVLDPTIGIVEFLQYEGNNSNLKIEAVKENAQQILVNRSLELYDLCYEMGENSETVMNKEPALQAAFLEHVSTHSVNVQHEILRNEVWIGRKKLCGYNDWINYTATITSEIRERLSRADEDRIVAIDSMEGSLQLLQDLVTLNQPFSTWGIEPLDNFTPILRHRLVVVVGRENIGKTKFAVDKAVNVLIDGGRVEFMCGESHKAQVFGDIMINYVFKKYNIIIRHEHVAAPEECPEDIRKIICMTIDEVASSRNLILRDAFDYATCYDELVTDYEKYHFDMCVIDHSCALIGAAGDGSVKSNIDKLASDCRIFRRKYPVCILVTSHPSTIAKESLSRDRPIDGSPTKGSQNLSVDADEVFVLRDNPTLDKQNLIVLENFKRRNAGRAEDVILQKRFDVNAFIYDPARQAADVSLELEKEEALRQYEEQFAEMLDDDDNNYIDIGG